MTQILDKPKDQRLIHRGMTWAQLKCATNMMSLRLPIISSRDTAR